MQRAGNLALETHNNGPRSERKRPRGRRRADEEVPEEWPTRADPCAESTVETSGVHYGPRTHAYCKSPAVEEGSVVEQSAADRSSFWGHSLRSLARCAERDSRKTKRLGCIARPKRTVGTSYAEVLRDYERSVLDQPETECGSSQKKKRHYRNNNRQMEKHDVFAVDNIVFTSSKKDLRMEQDSEQIEVPRFRVLDHSYYSHTLGDENAGTETKEEGKGGSEEDDSNGRYETLHRQYEIKEEMDKYPTE